MRLYMGPVLVMVSLYLYYEDLGLSNFIIAFSAAFGFVYTMKPFITFMASGIKDEKIEFAIDGDTLIFKDRLNEAEIDLQKNILQENRKYYFIRLDNGQTLFFPKDKLNEEQADSLYNALNKADTE